MNSLSQLPELGEDLLGFEAKIVYLANTEAPLSGGRSGHSQLGHQCHQLLLSAVVDIPLDAAPLRLGGVDDATRQPSIHQCQPQLPGKGPDQLDIVLVDRPLGLRPAEDFTDLLITCPEGHAQSRLAGHWSGFGSCAVVEDGLRPGQANGSLDGFDQLGQQLGGFGGLFEGHSEFGNRLVLAGTSPEHAAVRHSLQTAPGRLEQNGNEHRDNHRRLDTESEPSPGDPESGGSSDVDQQDDEGEGAVNDRPADDDVDIDPCGLQHGDHHRSRDQEHRDQGGYHGQHRDSCPGGGMTPNSGRTKPIDPRRMAMTPARRTQRICLRSRVGAER